MRSYWRERLGLTPTEFYPMDGSGLSPEGRLSSGALSLILSELWRDQSLHKPFLASLPEAGVEGTVRSLSIPSEVTAYLKSGSMRGVRGYAGYLFMKTSGTASSTSLTEPSIVLRRVRPSPAS